MLPFLLTALLAATPPAPSSPPAVEPALTWAGHTWARGPSAYGAAAGFHVADDTLIAAETPTGEGGILWLAGDHPAFTLTVQVRADQPADGGIYVGADRQGRGYQVRLDNWQRDGNIGGIYCDGVPGGIVADTGALSPPWRQQAWNDLRLTVTRRPSAADGAVRIQVWVNGTAVTNYDAPDTPGARIGLQLHSNIQPDHHAPGNQVHFRHFTLIPHPANP